MLEVSQRAQLMPPSPIRKLTPYADDAKERGITVHHLNIGQPDIAAPAALLRAVHRATLREFEYSHSAGTLSYRRHLAEYYQDMALPVTTQDIIVTAGGSEAILFALLTCLNPGDELIVSEPFYANYNGFAHMAGVQVVPVTATLDTGFALPPIAEFERVITPRTKAILICNPGNPTGYRYSRTELEQLRDLCLARDLFLISDEVYREFCYDGNFVSALHLRGAHEHVVLVDSISKRYSACGVRLGAFVTKNRAVYDAALRFAQARLSPAGLAQLLGEAAAEIPEHYFDDTRAEYQARRDLMVRRLQAMPGVSCPTPGGAFYVMARLPVDDSEKFAQWLLEGFHYQNQTLMLAPAAGFYATPGLGRDEVRLAYVLNLASIDAAMTCLEKALEVYPGRTINRPEPAEATEEPVEEVNG